MKLRMAIAMAFLAGACGTGSAQDGGKIGWQGKGKDADIKKILEQAKKDGKGTMMFFTSEGWGPCKTLSAGAFSDDKVVEASKKLVPIFVDCEWGKKNNDLSQKYGIRGYPTVLFTDPDGKEIDRVKQRDAAAVTAQIDEVAKKFPGKKK